MLTPILQAYCDSAFSLKRLPKIRWLSLTYSLNPESVRKDDSVLIRRATEEDIAYLENHANVGDNIVQSSLQFWRDHGFRCLYLGFFDDEETPTVFQYIIDDSCNHLYAGMDYGGMYKPQSPDSVQAENIYLFRDKRRKQAALRFQQHMFAELLDQGKTTVRTHINLENRAALLWARNVGFRPDKWITLIRFNLPGLRGRRKRFFHSPLRSQEWNSYPLKLFTDRKRSATLQASPESAR